MASILLHSCCGPCATYTVKHWRQQRLEVAAFWYNPNIHPIAEHQRRYETMVEFARVVELALITGASLEMGEFLCRVVGYEADRCQRCFLLRLSQTADTAVAQGFDSFSTTLLISPYQEHSLLKEVGEMVGHAKGVRFLYQDLRDGYRESRRMARELGLYRQKYCGCIYSREERFGGVHS